MAENIIISGIEQKALEQFKKILNESSANVGNGSVSKISRNIDVSDGNDINETEKKLADLKKIQEDLQHGYNEMLTKSYRLMAQQSEEAARQRKEKYAALMAIKQEVKLTQLHLDTLKEEEKVGENITNGKIQQLDVEERINKVLNSRSEIYKAQEEAEKAYIEKHLESFEAIIKKQKEIASGNTIIDKRVERLSHFNGKKNSGAEIFQLIGNFSKSFNEKWKGETLGRNVGEAVSKVTNGIAKGGAFINNGKMDVGALADKMTGALSKAGPWGAAAGGFLQVLKTAFDMYSKVNTAASKFARTVGGGAATIDRMEFSMAKIAKDISTSGDKFVSWNQRAYDAAKLLESAAEYSSAIGRTTEYLSKADFKALQDLKDYGVSFDIVSQFDTFGVAASEVSERLAKLYGTAGKHGLNAKAVSDTVTKNLKMAQQYTFAGGVRALDRMAEKAVMLKYNMEAVSRFADKVSTLEGAAQSAAGLSVLGGSFARMANPLSMLYGGLQDPERLNEMMLNMTKGMAHWDSRKGQFDMAGVDRMRLRAAAENMGVDFNDLYNMAVNQTRQQMVDNEIRGIDDEETRKYIRNIATIKNGKSYVSLGGEEKEVSSLTPADKERLKKESEEKERRDGATLGDILGETRSTQEKLDEIIEQIKTKLVFGVMALVDRFVTKSGSANTYADMARYGMSQNATEQYNRLNKVRENPSSAQAFYASASKEDRAAMHAMGWFDGTGKYVGSTSSKEEELELFKKHLSESQGKAYGGVIRGKGTSKSDSIPAWLSNGEFVVNASATSKHLPELQAMNAEGFASGTNVPIRAGKNQYNLGSGVLPPMSTSGVGVSGVQHVSIDPLQVSGTLTLQVAGGGSKTIDANELFTPENVNILMRKLQESFGFRLDKTEFRMPKYLNGTF